MGDVSAEPSMEEILSSIKRIIAEEGEPAPMKPRRPSARPSPPGAGFSSGDIAVEPPEVLELSDPLPMTPGSATAPPPSSDTEAGPIVSPETLAATRGTLDSLSRLVTRPEPGTDGTLEGLVRDMLRPMLREWLDANLPALVERIVAREVAKIAGTR